MRGALQRVPSEAWPGIVLLVAAILAMAIANSSWAPFQNDLLQSIGTVSFRSIEISMPLAEWVKNLLMAVFFFYVGLELKRELLEGALSSLKTALMPLIAALGGVIVPALFYLAVTGGTGFEHGWAIPAATDIAFALGVVALLGARVPPALKVFLLAIAVVDDLIAILVIACFYSQSLELAWLLGAGLCYLPMLALMLGRRPWHGPYMLLAMPLWVCMQMSGVNPTIAGVLAALAIPMRDRQGRALLTEIEHGLRPYVHYGVMPAFALASAGAALGGSLASAAGHPVALGIGLGLLVGKPVGIVLGTLLAAALLKAERPGSLPSIVGIGFIAGIGFTMSLFIGKLAFAGDGVELAVKLGVYGGSIAAALTGLAILAFVHREPPRTATEPDEADIFTGGGDADRLRRRRRRPALS
jgi:NhaA family Na+:H+ antiporter